MRNLDAPVAADHRAYAITVGLQDEHGNQITAVEVKLTGFATLGELLTVLEVVRTSDALLQAQAEVMSSTQEEFAKNLADLQAKARLDAGLPVLADLIIDERDNEQGELDFVETVPCSRCDGCGRLADSDDQEPWTAWTSLPAGSRTAVDLGLVKPVTCHVCNGAGLVAA